jgi:hypothetical protein
VEESLVLFNNQVKIAETAHSIGIGPKIIDHFVCYQDYGLSYGFIVEERLNGKNLGEWARSKTDEELKEMRKKVRDMIRKMHTHFTHNKMWGQRDIIVDSNGTPYVIGLSRATEISKPEVEDEDVGDVGDDAGDSKKKEDYRVLEFLKPKKTWAERSKENARENVVEYIVVETIRRALDRDTGFLTLS